MVLKTVSSVSGGGGNASGTVTQVNTGTGLTGGPITTTGTVSIANTGVTQGVYGGSGNLVSIIVTPTGQINSASNVALVLSNTSVTAGAYGSSTAVSTFTVFSDGRLNSASNVAIANIVLGNAQLQVGQTTTTVGNLTLNSPVINNPSGNVVPAIPASSISNSLLANSSVTLGNTAAALGGTVTTLGNLTLTNGTVNNVLIVGPTALRNMTFPDANGTVVTANTTVVIQVGYSVNAYSLGTVSANLTLGMSNGNYQYMTANGTFTITAPTSDGAIDVLVVNGAGANTISFSGFTVGSSTGSTYATTNGNKFILSVRRINGNSTYSWYAMQ